MTDYEEILSKRALIIIGSIWMTILVVGIILITLGLNEAFYVRDPTIQIIFEIITSSGSSFYIILLIAILTFSYDKRFSKNFFILYIFSGFLNTLLKVSIKDPRPTTNFLRSEPVQGYGFPSGHAQLAVTNWGFVAYQFKDKLKPNVVPILFSIFIFLIAISRIILGVHDIQDIVGGLLIGIALLLLFIYLNPIISEITEKLSLSIKIIIAVIIPILVYLIGTLFFSETRYSVNIYAIMAGSLFGILIGNIFEEKYIKYEPTELEAKQKIINLVIGLVILLIYLIFIYRSITGTDFHEFVRNAIISLMITLVMPFIFTKIKKN